MEMENRAPERSSDALLSISPISDGTGVEFVDHIERRQFTIQTPRRVVPSRVSTDEFEFPVSRAVTFDTSSFTIPNQFGVVIRNSLGFMVAEVTKGERDSFPPDVYSLDPGAPIKTYLRFDEGFSIDVSDRGITVTLDSVAPVDVGIRSHHKQPAAAITTSDDVEDIMEAVSYFGSALKTFSCERSYPTLRGHPPTLKRGPNLSVPSILDRPDTGVTIEVPPTLEHVFTTASLAYYLGATLTPGEEPKLVTDDGFVHQLDCPPRGFEDEVERVLKQTFFLDCLTRTEGLFQVDLHERNQVEAPLDLDFESLYDDPLPVQLATYLSVPYGTIEPYVPKWKLTAYATPDPKYVNTLPFLVNDLAVVRSARSGAGDQSEASRRAVMDDRVLAKGLQRSAAQSAKTPDLVRVEEGDSIEQAWIGEGAPIGASKVMIDAFENRLGRSPAGENIEITVVCNAAEMSQEGDLVNEVYGSREDLPFDLSVHQELEKQELESLLRRDIDFLHYIGHIDARGFECSDGHLDAATLDKTDVDVFFLNACTSYEQGMNLIRAGSIAGVVTLQDVINSGAERIGMTLARLLNAGFPLTSALNLAKNQSIMGGHYLVIGDGGIDIGQPEGSLPTCCNIHNEDSKFNIDYITFPNTERGLGSIVNPHIAEKPDFLLVSNKNRTYDVDRKKLREFVNLQEMPLRFNQQLTWSSKLLENSL